MDILLLLIFALAIAALFIRITIVEEGTAKAVMVFGKFSKIIFQWENHWMDYNWNIWRELEEDSPDKKSEKKVKGRLFGGLWIYFWPFQKIHRYKHRWTDIRLKDSEMKVEFHEEKNFDHVLLKPAVYAFKLTAVETKPPERIPVDVLVLVTLRIRNPYLFLFVAPPTPLEDALARVSAETRALVTGCFIDELLQLKGESLWTLLRGAKVIEETLQKWGIKLAEKGIEIREIDLPPQYQRAAGAKKEEELKAAGRAAQAVGAVIEMIAQARGKLANEIRAEIDISPELRQEFLKLAKDLIVRQLAIEGGSYLDIRVQGAEGIEKMILNALAAWQRMPLGRGIKKVEEKVNISPAEETPADKLYKKLKRESEEKLKK